MKILFYLIGWQLAVTTVYGQGTLSGYQNYDFVPGNKILFEDHFTDDRIGEAASHWRQDGGQGVVIEQDSMRCYSILKFYSEFSPRLKQTAYLPADFTIEYDAYLDAGYDSNSGVGLSLSAGDERTDVDVNRSQVTIFTQGRKITGDLPKELRDDSFLNKWHHFALSVRDGQLKFYCDQYRVISDPDFSFRPTRMSIWGNNSGEMPMYFANVRITDGSGQLLVNSLLTDSKFVTRGITFDLNKATIKPESMGVINEMVTFLNANPTIRLQVGGHTDSDGTPEHNQQLSESRAKAVRQCLIDKGIDASRLEAVGFGEQQPLNGNTTPEEKAENRRVEFIKL